MGFPPGVTVKDYTSGGSAGYPNPNRGTPPERFATLIHNRTAYAQAAADGTTVFEGRDQAAIDEIRALAREVRNALSI